MGSLHRVWLAACEHVAGLLGAVGTIAIFGNFLMRKVEAEIKIINDVKSAFLIGADSIGVFCPWAHEESLNLLRGMQMRFHQIDAALS